MDYLTKEKPKFQFQMEVMLFYFSIDIYETGE